MNHIKYTSTIVLALCCTTAAFAQQKRISGHVFSKADGAIVMANVVEKDKSNRVVSAAQTDMSGNFTMTIKNPNKCKKQFIFVIIISMIILYAI